MEAAEKKLVPTLQPSNCQLVESGAGRPSITGGVMSVIKCRHPELQPALTLTGALEVPCHWDKLKEEKTWNIEDPSRC